MFVIKKDGTKESFNEDKIKKAAIKSAERALIKLTEQDFADLFNLIKETLSKKHREDISVEELHYYVETALEQVNPVVAKSYKDYRNYKQDFVHMLDEVYKKSQTIMYIGDKENSNSDSALVSTKRSLIFNQLNKELYKKFFLTKEELQACKDGYIYVHDMSARRDCMNCFRRDTRFITQEGVKSFYDFTDGEETIVLTHLGNWKKAVVHKYGNQPIQKVTFRRGTSTGNEKVVYCTPNHRWIKKDGTETTTLEVGDVLWGIPDITEINWDIMSFEERRLWCEGFALGDGSMAGTRKGYSAEKYNIIRLCGNKIKYASRFSDIGCSVKEIKGSTDKIVHFFTLNSKEIPVLKINYSNAKYYVNGFLSADGHLGSEVRTPNFKGVQITGAHYRILEKLFNISGYFITNKKDLAGTVTNYGVRKTDTYHYGFYSTGGKNSNWRVKSIEPDVLNPKSEVWCLEVEDDHSFILEGGIPTGNCCLFDVGAVLKGGFEMGNIWYNEPKTLDVAFDVIGDIVLSAASQQYGRHL